MPVHVVAGAFDDQQLTHSARRHLIKLLGDLRRHSLIVCRRNKHYRPVADSLHCVEHVELSTVEPRAALYEILQFVSDRKYWQVKKELEMMIDRVIERKKRAVRNDRGDLGSLSRRKQRCRGAHRNPKGNYPVICSRLIAQISRRGFDIQSLIVAETHASLAARAVIARVVQQGAITQPAQIHRTLEKLAPRSEKPV